MVWHALATYRDTTGASRFALITEAAKYDLASIAATSHAAGLQPLMEKGLPDAFGHWPQISKTLAALAAEIAAGKEMAGKLPDAITLLQPFMPRNIYAAASNYIEHANEMGTILAAKAESAPYVFMKAASSVIGPEQPIILPAASTKVDWEVELAAVIGKRTKNVSKEQALASIAAYSIMNDVSARDLSKRTDYPFKFDWFRGKSFDTFGPFGPWLVPDHCVGDPQSLDLSLSVSGQIMQNDNTSRMIWSVAEQIAYLSSILTLEPGDVIATGTPDGVGMGRGQFLQPGDLVEAKIEKIGTLRNPVRASA